MTDKQLKSLSKVQMLDILHQQEREIERLSTEVSKPRSADPEASALLSGIMQAAQAAADSYVKNMVVAENEKIEGIAKLESDTRRRVEEAERAAEMASETVKKLVTDMSNVFSWQIDLIKSMQDEFYEKIGATSLKDILPPRRPDALAQQQDAFSQQEDLEAPQPDDYRFAQPDLTASLWPDDIVPQRAEPFADRDGELPQRRTISFTPRDNDSHIADSFPAHDDEPVPPPPDPYTMRDEGSAPYASREDEAIPRRTISFATRDDGATRPNPYSMRDDGATRPNPYSMRDDAAPRPNPYSMRDDSAPDPYSMRDEEPTVRIPGANAAREAEPAPHRPDSYAAMQEEFAAAQREAYAAHPSADPEFTSRQPIILPAQLPTEPDA